MQNEIVESVNIYKDWINQYYDIIKEIDERAAKILEAISIKNTTNITEISKFLNMPVSTVSSIISKLRRKNILFIKALINIAELGLIPYATILYHTTEQNAMRILSANRKYWIYYAKGRSDRPCFYVKYVIPYGRERDFIEFLNTALQLNLITDYEIYPTSVDYDPPLSFKDFNFQNRTWSFNWNSFLEHVHNMKPIPNKFLEGYPLTTNTKIFDSIDLKILKSLRFDAFVSLRSIQRSLGNVTVQTVYYHYINHVIKRNLIAGIRTVFIPYPYVVNGKITTDSIMIFITFKDQEWMLKFANALNGIYAAAVSRILGNNTLIFNVMLLHIEMPEFFNMLDKLIEEGVITSYRYVWLDLRTGKNEHLPYSAYDTKTGKWRWNQEEYLLNLQRSLEVKATGTT